MNAKEDRLTLQIASSRDDVNAEAFLIVFREMLVALKEINKTNSNHGVETIEWRIADIGQNSPINATLVGDSLSAKNGKAFLDAIGTIGTFVSGVEHLDRKNTCPPGFNQAALESTSRLQRATAKGVAEIKFKTSRRTVVATKNSGANAQYAMKRLEQKRVKGTGRYTEYSTIEGEIIQLSALSGSDDTISIVDDLTGVRTKCYFHGMQLEREARSAWKRRVSVTGKVTFDKGTGEPKRMDVEEIKILRDRSELPQMQDLLGIDITGGIESSEYIRGIRDAE